MDYFLPLRWCNAFFEPFILEWYNKLRDTDNPFILGLQVLGVPFVSAEFIYFLC